MRFCASLLVLLVACGDEDPMADWVPNTGPPARVTGMTFVFGPNAPGLTLDGATVAVTEDPDVVTTVAADGTFTLDVPSGGPSTFTLTQDGFHLNQSATLEIGVDGIPMLGFQAPIEETFELLGNLARVTPDPTRCQIASTVSRAGTEPYGGDALGVERATVTLDPSSAEIGPIYFNYAGGTIFPDRMLTATSIDGGVIFANVPVGEYTMTAHKAGTMFAPVHIRCRAGVLVNAAPPNDLREL
jgi:hypothetical protein